MYIVWSSQQTMNNLIFFIFLGISEENFTKLIQHAQIPAEDTEMIKNLQFVGCNVVVDVSWQYL